MAGAVALLSGGLDSTVSLLFAQREVQIALAITFDYGQKARLNEIRASKNLCMSYGIKHRIIELPFMRDMQSGIIEDSTVTVHKPWVPNRNGLFLNLAACYAENLGARLVVCGFNWEEAADFPDNSPEYVEALNKALFFSTSNHVEVVSFVQEMTKVEIVKAAVSMGLDLRCLWSCYEGGRKPCGKCPSCLRNREAYKKAGIEYIEDFIY